MPVMDEIERKRAWADYMAQYMLTHPEQREAARVRSKAWRERNREHHRAYSRQWAKDHPERVRARYTTERARRALLDTKWKIGQARYDEILAAQGGHCFFCSRTEADVKGRHLVIDHDHRTGAVRGLLCYGCNISLGYYERGQRSRISPADFQRYLVAASSWY